MPLRSKVSFVFGVGILGWVALTFLPPARAQEMANQTVQARAAYLEQVNVYRQSDSEFLRARQQYYQLQTLASLEEAVRLSKVTQTERLKALITYFEAVLLTLNETRGLEIGIKDTLTKRVQDTLTSLRASEVELQKANDKPGLNRVDRALAAQEDTFTNVAYTTLAFIRYARIQSSLDYLGIASQAVYDDIQARNLNASDAAVKQRAYDELVRLIQEQKESLAKIKSNLQSSPTNGISKDTYTSLSSKLSDMYAAIQKGAGFVRELNK